MRPVRTTRRKSSTKEVVEVSDDDEEDEGLSQRPTKRAKIAQQDTINGSARNNIVQAVKRLEGGLLAIQSQAKTMEAELAVLKEAMEME